jgi:serine protease Do
MKKNFILGIVILLLIASAGISSGAFSIGWNDVNTFFSRFKTTDKETDAGIQVGEDTIRLIDEESVVIDVIKQVSDSVVTVGIEQQTPIFQYDPLDPFGLFSQPQQQGSETEEADIGSGFIISEDGLIVTNKHVVENTEYTYKVYTSENKTYDVENIYRDPSNDLAIIKISASGLKPVTLGNSDNIKVGQTVIALGTPLGEFRGTATKGIVSGLGRGISAGSPLQGMVEEIDDVIQTDAAINPGNSGGPLLDTAGQVIGINTAMASGAENIGFALPINIVKEAVKIFEETGSFDRAFLGISYWMIDRELSIVNDIPEGAYVREVVEGSSAAEAGLQKGDIITRFEGERIRAGEDDSLAQKIQSKRKGDRASITIWRDGKESDMTISLGEFDGR